MSLYHYSPVQGSRNNTQGAATNSRCSNYRIPPTANSNNRMQSQGQNRFSSTTVYGNSPNYQAAGNQYLHESPSGGFQGRQSMSRASGNSRVQGGRSSTQISGGPMTVSLPPNMMNAAIGMSSRSAAQRAPQSSQAVNQLGGANEGTIGPDGIKYIPLNWSDLLGGKEGMQGLQVSMAPSGDPGNPNRQLKFSFATPGQGDSHATAPGEVPLKVLSFEPVEDYPGKGGQPYNMNAQQPRQMPALPAAGNSGYQSNQGMQQNPLQQQINLASSQMMNSMFPANGKGQQPQMIMMPPVYYTPGKGVRNAPGQVGNSCKGCPNCKANALAPTGPQTRRY